MKQTCFSYEGSVSDVKSLLITVIPKGSIYTQDGKSYSSHWSLE